MRVYIYARDKYYNIKYKVKWVLLSSSLGNVV